eukprot:XP_016662407.1 PREDICTED: uncharacterized protein LOC100571278 isoform X3 [Acyrthosiphon pisum]
MKMKCLLFAVNSQNTGITTIVTTGDFLCSILQLQMRKQQLLCIPVSSVQQDVQAQG